MSGKHASPPTPQEVVLAALVTPVPCPKCEKTATCRCHVKGPETRQTRRADLIVAALREYGHLAPVGAQVTAQDLTEAAQWLASKSRHPRYSGDGWERLLTSEVDVDMAAINAEKHLMRSEVARFEAVREMLRDAAQRTAQEAAQ